jgi:DNA-binding NarL/FixJ family response regulator
MTTQQSHQRLLALLSDILIQINALQAQSDPAAARVREELKKLEVMAREALSLLRAGDEEEPLAALEGTTLAEALSRMVEETAEMLGISSRISFSGIDGEQPSRGHNLHPTAIRLLYLIAHETLYQIQQRARARRLRLTLAYGPEDVQMSIEYDEKDLHKNEAEAQDHPAPPFIAQDPHREGLYTSSSMQDVETPLVGVFPPGISPPVETSIMNDLRYRLALISGTLRIEPAGNESANSRGTRVVANVPYTPHAHDLTNGTAQSLSAPPTSRGESEPENEVIRVLIVDGQSVTRAGLRHLLETYSNIQIVGEAADGIQATSEALELGPRVILMDTQLPDGQSIEALRQVKQLNQDIKVLMLSARDREEYLYETLRAGADGYVLKDIAPDELAHAIRVVARGEMLIQPQLAGRLLSRVGRQGRGYDTLTTRELEVLRLLARGLRNKEIAARLYVSERTVSFHLANIYQKLNVSGRTEALSKALEQGLITA